jgi:hypothetical protein
MPSPPDRPERQDAPDNDEVAFYRQHQADWPALLERLREQHEFGLKLAEADSVAVLSQWFTAADGGWQPDADRSGLLGADAFGVAWEYEGVHDIPSAFNGLPASDRRVTVRGFTVIAADQSRGGRAQIRRYVDWAGVFAQLGLTLNWRIPLSPPEPDPGHAPAST